MSFAPSRRQMLKTALAAVPALPTMRAAESPDTRQATGLKIGEITPTSAIVWTRRTTAATRLDNGIKRRGHVPNAAKPKPGEDINTFEGACPASPGYVRVSYEAVSGSGGRKTTEWMEASTENDAVAQLRLEGLRPATGYRISVETSATKGGKADRALTGKFATAPAADANTPVRFALLSCQIFHKMDRNDGFAIYRAIEKWDPAFLLGCGDNVYYDSEDPVVNSPACARYHWARMFSLPTLQSCLRNVPGYWQKDDHDLWDDDCYPGMKKVKTAPFTLSEGQKIFREQVPAPPLGQPLYRTFRWGKDVELWLPDSRDYRDPNPAPDGPSKSIWGEQQKKWIEQSLTNSPATWKIMVNPNPIVGPDHKRKNDNHANPAFASEGLEFRRWLKDHVDGHVILMNGDRHWQYHSIDPDTGVHEFGCGPASDAHAISPSEGEDPRYHKFLRIKGGYLAVMFNPGDRDANLVLEHRDVNGATMNRATFKRPA